jgi:hypothetical protein
MTLSRHRAAARTAVAVGVAVLATAQPTAPTLAAHDAQVAGPARAVDVDLTPSVQKPIAGDWVTFTANGPRSWRDSAAKVRYRKSKEADWEKLATSRTDGDGDIKLRQRANGVGKQFYQVVIPGRGRTSIAAVTVHRWYYLADLEPIATEIEGRPGGCTGGCTGFYEGAVDIGGRRYSRSWIMRVDDDGDRSTTTYNASKKCRTFDATVGITDDSDTSTGGFTINLGGDDIDLAEVSTGTGAAVSTDLRGVFRIVVASFNTGDGEDIDTAWGDARMLCRGKP